MKAWEDPFLTIIAYGISLGIAIAAAFAGLAAGCYMLSRVVV